MQKVKTLRVLTYTAFILSLCVPSHADILEDFRNRATSELNNFREEKTAELEEFRRRVNEEIAVFMSRPWTPVKVSPKIDLPVDPSPDPIHIDMDTVKQRIPQPVVIEEVIKIPEPAPRPQPIEPIIEIKPKIGDPVVDITPVVKERYFDVILYGTKFSFRLPDLSDFRLKSENPAGYADAWRSLNNTSTNNLILDCLSQRKDKALCDWAFMQLLKAVSCNLYPDDSAKSTLLTGFLLSQSGYRIRFATDSRNNLHLLYSPAGVVYNVPSLKINGFTYYVATEFDKNDLAYRVCDFKCPGEKQMSFEITQAMRLDYEPSQTRNIVVHNYPEIEVSVTTNRNLIDFYDTYPVATAGANRYTQWAIYANTPVSPELKRDLYPVLEEAVKGKSQREAANMLIHLAESFPYGYDSEIWGRDRAFFMDESWHYPLSDCEDHAIHFTRLVRDILGLEAVLVYYPGHLASAVAFTDPEIKGDYVMHRGKKFVICDPTIFYADVGTTMAGCNNESAVLIDLMRPKIDFDESAETSYK